MNPLSIRERGHLARIFTLPSSPMTSVLRPLLSLPLHLVLKLNTKHLNLLFVLGEILGNWEAEKSSTGVF